MMEAETLSETLEAQSILAGLIAREDAIAFSWRESNRCYLLLNIFL
jgi:hypothetical protein